MGPSFRQPLHGCGISPAFPVSGSGNGLALDPGGALGLFVQGDLAYLALG